MKYKHTHPTNPVSSGHKASLNGFGALRSILETACAEAGCSRSALTVLSTQIDPYRLDTPTGHCVGQWTAEQFNHAVPRSKRIHLRGLFYTIVVRGDVRKPNGDIFVNTNDDWEWLSETAVKSARWLGYVPFDRITDNRNAAPIIHRKARVKPKALVSIGVDVAIPSAEDLEPAPIAEGFVARQPHHFVLFGEKASLEDVLLPIARAKQADLYLPTGEISDTLLFQIARDANEDGRPLVVFTFSDSDPAGRQMPISIGRKLQAFRDLLFPKLRFEVVPVALTVEQVGQLGLPSTPLKETEKRADRWREAFGGAEQTEIDALATLQPDVLRQIAEDAFDPYFDRTLEDRVNEARDVWMREAQEAIDAQIDPEILAALREEAAGRLAELETAIAEINERLRLAADHFTLPAIRVPRPEVDEDAARQALINFDDSWAVATRALIERKRYGIE
jgi:hypothetical protein